MKMKKTPKNLKQCYKFLDDLNADDVKRWLSREENEALAIAHMGIGMWMRNEWGLWSGKNELCEYFNKLGIEHADDMSGIILTSYHRLKNDKPIELESQIKKYKQHWENINSKVKSPIEDDNDNENNDEMYF